MRINVVTTNWNGLDGGEHDVDVNAIGAPVIAGAEAAGAIQVVGETDAERALLDPYIQSQADGEAAYDAAQADGAWQEGNLQQFLLDAPAALAALEPLDPRRGWLLAGAVDACNRLGDTEGAAAWQTQLDDLRAAIAAADAQAAADAGAAT